MTPGSSTSKRGFASMDSDRQREIASKGGKSVKDIWKLIGRGLKTSGFTVILQ